MKIHTRFLPTINGLLHLGHLYTILVNRAEAQRSGGTFSWVFDNMQSEWNDMLGADKVAEYAGGMLDDLDWLGIKPDVIHYTSQLLPGVHNAIENRFHYHIDEIMAYRGPAEAIHFGPPLYPYTEKLTAEKVVIDFHLGVNWVIRGWELMTEDCLYRHYCHIFRLPMPRMTYIPRLACDGETVSKTHGKYQIHEFREAGMTAHNLIIMLARDCLDDPAVGWGVDNIKHNPAIGAWADEVLHAVPA
jgi:glutamyl/glutaminyl-tRNA synthetase